VATEGTLDQVHLRVWMAWTYILTCGLCLMVEQP